MGVLVRVSLAIAFLLAGTTQAFAIRQASELLTILQGIDTTATSGIGTGSSYSWGGGVKLRLGNEDDPTSYAGDLHAQFSSQISPEDPTVTPITVKHVNNWTGGTALHINSSWSFQLDLDSSRDPYESLSTDGMKASLGYETVRLYYRYARSKIESQSPPILGFSYKGSYIYQHLVGSDLSLDLSDVDNLSFKGEYSIFSPNARAFNDLLSNAFYSSVANLGDTVQNFEQWHFETGWSRKWNDVWDSNISAGVSHLIIPNNPLLTFDVATGYQFNEQFHLQVGAEYTHDPAEHTLMATFELAYSWDRAPKGQGSENVKR